MVLYLAKQMILRITNEQEKIREVVNQFNKTHITTHNII